MIFSLEIAFTQLQQKHTGYSNRNKFPVMLIQELLWWDIQIQAKHRSINKNEDESGTWIKQWREKFSSHLHCLLLVCSLEEQRAALGWCPEIFPSVEFAPLPWRNQFLSYNVWLKGISIFDFRWVQTVSRCCPSLRDSYSNSDFSQPMCFVCPRKLY